jgi:uncharacterized protein GlcG (DUF336 family)
VLFSLELEQNIRRLQMKAFRFSFLIVAALVLLSSTVSSQQAPAKNPGKAPGKNSQQSQTSDVEAGIGQGGLEYGQVRPMTADLAKQLVAAAMKSSCSPPQGSCSGAFCVVDDAGVLVYLKVIDGVISAAPKLCIAKAETPAAWRRPTQTFQDSVNKGTNTSYAGGAFPEMSIAPGGIPLFKGGRIVGGFGLAAVGAATKQIDDAVIAEATKIFGKQSR